MKCNSIKRIAPGLAFLAALICTDVRAVELSGNLTRVTGGTEPATVARSLAASFTTDASAHDLTSVTLLLANPTPGSAALELYSDGNLEPESLMATMTSPVGYSATLSPAVFVADGIPLDTDTTYWLVLRVLAGSFEWAWSTDNTGEGSGFDGTWGVTEIGLGEGNPAWFTYDQYPTQMSVVVDELSEPVPAVSTWGMLIFVLLISCAGTVLLSRRALVPRPLSFATVRS